MRRAPKQCTWAIRVHGGQRAPCVAILAAVIARPRAHDGQSTFLFAQDLSGPDICTSKVLVGTRLHHFATLRHGDGCWHVPHRHVPAGGGTRAMECGLCAAVPPPDRWTIWQQPVSLAALLSVSSLHQALAGRLSGTVSRLASQPRL